VEFYSPAKEEFHALELIIVFFIQNILLPGATAQ
jgi:hypothetical protein